MKYLIITSHPYTGSFNAAAAKTIEQTAADRGHKVSTIDLVRDGFNPVMTADDLKAWSQMQSVDPMVKTYQAQIEQADIIVFVFPVWWGAMPAVLKGFCDKVLLPGWAYRHGDNGEMIGQLTGKQAIVITTMETPVEVFNSYFHNPVEGAFIKDTLMICGLEIARFEQIDNIVSGGQERAKTKLKEIANWI